MIGWLVSTWGQVWPNLLADALVSGVVWVKVHTVHQHVRGLRDRVDALHEKVTATNTQDGPSQAT